MESWSIMAYSYGLSQSLEILFYIELKSNNAEEKYLTIQEISNKLNIPVPSIKRLVGLLKNKGFIESKKGVNGGLALTRSSDEISILDVYLAIEGNLSQFKSYEDFPIDSFKHKDEVEYMLLKKREIFKKAENAMYDVLKKSNIGDFLKE